MNERFEGQTYYELLEVNPQAGPTDIYNAYQRARQTYSPSSPALYSMFTPQEAQELMVLIEEAYRTLSHQARRREYDMKLGLIDPRVNAQPKSFVQNENLRAAYASAPAKTPSATTSARKADDPWLGPVKVVPKSKEELPKGFGRTKFGTYEIKDDIENEIASITECDGSFLQKIRLYKGVTLEQLSEEIRVIKSTLVALEANDLEVLPVAVFTRGFVVQMSRAMNVDDKKVGNAYMKFFKARKVVK